MRATNEKFTANPGTPSQQKRADVEAIMSARLRVFTVSVTALSAGLTATVNVVLSVGGLEETVTVTGESPLVDTHATKQQTTFTRENMDEVPLTKNYAAMAALIPGVNTSVIGAASNQDVGG